MIELLVLSGLGVLEIVKGVSTHIVGEFPFAEEVKFFAEGDVFVEAYPVVHVAFACFQHGVVELELHRESVFLDDGFEIIHIVVRVPEIVRLHHGVVKAEVVP